MVNTSEARGQLHPVILDLQKCDKRFTSSGLQEAIIQSVSIVVRLLVLNFGVQALNTKKALPLLPAAYKASFGVQKCLA